MCIAIDLKLSFTLFTTRNVMSIMQLTTTTSSCTLLTKLVIVMIRDVHVVLKWRWSFLMDGGHPRFHVVNPINPKPWTYMNLLFTNDWRKVCFSTIIFRYHHPHEDFNPAMSTIATISQGRWTGCRDRRDWDLQAWCHHQSYPAWGSQDFSTWFLKA